MINHADDEAQSILNSTEIDAIKINVRNKIYELKGSLITPTMDQIKNRQNAMAWLTVGDGKKYYKTVTEFNYQLNTLLSKHQAVEKYHEAIYGENPNKEGGFYDFHAKKGLMHDGLELLDYFLDQYPDILHFLNDSLNHPDSLIAEAGRAYYDWCDDTFKQTLEILSKTAQPDINHEEQCEFLELKNKALKQNKKSLPSSSTLFAPHTVQLVSPDGEHTTLNHGQYQATVGALKRFGFLVGTERNSPPLTQVNLLKQAAKMLANHDAPTYQEAENLYRKLNNL